MGYFDPQVCSRCGTEWDHHPLLDVACPHCGADEGELCRRPSGHPVPEGFHREREHAALAAGALSTCPGETGATTTDTTTDVGSSPQESGSSGGYGTDQPDQRQLWEY